MSTNEHKPDWRVLYAFVQGLADDTDITYADIAGVLGTDDPARAHMAVMGCRKQLAKDGKGSSLTNHRGRGYRLLTRQPPPMLQPGSVVLSTSARVHLAMAVRDFLQSDKVWRLSRTEAAGLVRIMRQLAGPAHTIALSFDEESETAA
jgi:hypothetical protein